ncbi:MAG: hypothetical protein ISR58_12615 [Anaerolineales bacterium]|nr:hypothetical protein [Chloroflexota bacterium]MBL6982022.1 hypothetical protein [Anaerolineales bacterium]
MESDNRIYHLPLLLLAVLTLFAAAWAGLLRLGWDWPALQPELQKIHGPLMISGFLGTLISLERAVALGKRWAYIGPLMIGVGSVLLAFGISEIIGPLLMTLGSLWLVLIFVVVLRQHMAPYTIVMAMGALALFLGNSLWLLGWEIHYFVLWWAGFLILTIAGERLELSRIRMPSRNSLIGFGLILTWYVSGLFVMLWAFDLGVRLAAAGMLGLAFWLLHYDIARRTVRQTGLTRFIAVCLLGGYVWLAVAGIAGMIFGGLKSGAAYDLQLHAIFLGFVFTMIFGHAPIIFPAIIGTDINYRKLFYLPLILLHFSLLLRLVGENAGYLWARLWGGLFNVVAVLIYFGMIAPIGKRNE